MVSNLFQDSEKSLMGSTDELLKFSFCHHVMSWVFLRDEEGSGRFGVKKIILFETIHMHLYSELQS
jgi:hypothetical protein